MPSGVCVAGQSVRGNVVNVLETQKSLPKEAVSRQMVKLVAGLGLG